MESFINQCDPLHRKTIKNYSESGLVMGVIGLVISGMMLAIIMFGMILGFMGY